MALYKNHFEVVKWCIMKGALAPQDAVNNAGIEEALMRSELREEHDDCWRDDRRLLILAFYRERSWRHRRGVVIRRMNTPREARKGKDHHHPLV